MHLNEIVARRGSPLVDHDESKRKVNQICIAILGHTYVLMILRYGPPTFNLLTPTHNYVGGFKAWAPLLIDIK